MRLENADALGEEILSMLREHCDRIALVGSIRRRRPEVHDIDIVAQPSPKVVTQNWFGTVWKASNSLHAEVASLIQGGVFEKFLKKDGRTMVGETIAMLEYKGERVDLYYATPETWGGLMLVRTGSVEHNIILTGRAKERGWKLHADGSGVWDSREDGKGKRLDDGTEESIFQVLGVPYREPKDREVPK